MPPKKKELCCICCQPISVNKDEVIYCSGSCQQWLYIATVLAFFDRETKDWKPLQKKTALRANEKKALDSGQTEREKEDNPPQDAQN